MDGGLGAKKPMSAAMSPMARIALCAAGVRSNIAYRILVGNGFDAFSLSGGTQTLRQWWGDQAASILVREEVHA